MALFMPSGAQKALISKQNHYSFDALKSTVLSLKKILSPYVTNKNMRVAGLLSDDTNAILALVTLTEICDYAPLNPQLSPREFDDILKDYQCELLIISKSCSSLIPEDVSSRYTTLFFEDLMAEIKRDDRPRTNKHLALENEGRLILHTSGTTGQPKRVPITHEAMNISAKNIASSLGLTSTDLALNTLPLFHIGALVDVFLAPLSAQGAVAVTDQRSPEALAKEIQYYRPTWVQLVPTILQRLLEELDEEVLKDIGSSLRFIRCISSPLSQELQKQAEEKLGCPIIVMYGMTETAGQITTNGLDPAYRRYLSVGKPCSIDLQLIDENGNPVLTGQKGEIAVRGKTVFSGYENVDRDKIFVEEWFKTGDLGEIDQDGFLYIRGRIKEMVNIGGEKISPYEVETAALSYPDVKGAVAYALPHQSLGEQMGLTVASDKPIDIQGLKRHLKEQLAHYKCPHNIQLIEDLPLLPNSKIDRVLIKKQALAAMASSQDVKIVEPAHLSDEGQKIAQIWQQSLKSRSPEEEDDFFELGGDSLSAIRFLLELENSFDIKISPNQLFETPTFGALVEALEKETFLNVQPPSRAVQFLQQQMMGWPGQVALKNGLFRGFGTLKRGDVMFWSCGKVVDLENILNTFGKKHPLYFIASLVDMPERTQEDFRDAANVIADEIMTLKPEGDIIFGGYCGGAKLFYYVAEELISRGREIRLMLSFDYWPDRVSDYPVFHGVSIHSAHSARFNYVNPQLALPALHPKNGQFLPIEKGHEFMLDALPEYLAYFEKIITSDYDKVGESYKDQVDKGWDLAQRQQELAYQIKLEKTYRFFPRGNQLTFHLNIKNDSGMAWTKTHFSGLTLAARLLNLDNRYRSRIAGMTSFEKDINPGENIDLEITVQFPELTLPLMVEFALCNQGVIYHDKPKKGRYIHFMLPKFWR